MKRLAFSLAAEPVDGNWLKLEPDAYIVVMRRLASDWSRADEGLWEVLNLTTLGKGAPRPAPESIARSLDAAVAQAMTLREALNVAHRLVFQLRLSPNEVSQPAVSRRYAGGS